MSNNKKIYYINKRDNLIYDAEEADKYIDEKLKNLSLKNYHLFFDAYFENYFVPITTKKEEEILSKKVGNKQLE